MPVDCTRLLTSETWMLGTAEQKVAAMTLWLKSWHQVPAGSLPDNDKMLATLSETGIAWKRCRQHVLRGWVRCSDGRLYHPVVCEKALESHKIKAAQKARTEAARLAKANKNRSVTEPVTTSVTEPVTDTVTGSTRPDQTRQLREEREEISLPVPPTANVSAVSPDAEPSWPPAPLPSAVTTVVGVLAAKLEGRHKTTRVIGPHKPVRDVVEQMAVVAPPRIRARYATPEQLAEARARLGRKDAAE